MAKRRHEGEFELPFVALMDTMTNVVGVLIIVLVMIGISMANAVKKVFSDLPPVDQATYEQLQKELLADVSKKEAEDAELEKKKIEERLKQITEELKTLDVTMSKTNIKLDNLSEIEAKIDANKKLRDEEKAKMEKLLAEMEQLKARLDQTPVYTPPASTHVRLPNPRAFPEKANETRIMVAKPGVLFLNEKAYLQPILDGLEKVKSQLEYKEVKMDLFAKLLEKTLGNAAAAQKAWPEIVPFVGNLQLEPVAHAYRVLEEANLKPNKKLLESIADISLALNATMPAVAQAMVEAMKGDVSKWVALDPSKDPQKPILKATPSGGKITFNYGAKVSEVKANPRDVLNYFTQEIGELPAIKNGYKRQTIRVEKSTGPPETKIVDRVVYDAYKIRQMLEKAAANPSFSGAFVMKPTVRPGTTLVQLALTPKPGGGETLEQMRAETSNYKRLLRQVKGDPNGVVIFQVMPDAFETYHEARKIADEIGVAATWEFLAKLDIAVNVAGYEVQRFAPVPPTAPVVTGAPGAVRIAAPKRALD